MRYIPAVPLLFLFAAGCGSTGNAEPLKAVIEELTTRQGVGLRAALPGTPAVASPPERAPATASPRSISGPAYGPECSGFLSKLQEFCAIPAATSTCPAIQAGFEEMKKTKHSAALESSCREATAILQSNTDLVLKMSPP